MDLEEKNLQEPPCITSLDICITTENKLFADTCDLVSVCLKLPCGATLTSELMRPGGQNKAECWKIPLPQGFTLDMLEEARLIIKKRMNKDSDDSWTIGDIIASAKDKNELGIMIKQISDFKSETWLSSLQA